MSRSPVTAPSDAAAAGHVPAGSPATRLRVRYFAAAAEAAGRPEEEVRLPAGATVAELVAALVDAHGEPLGRVLAISSLLTGETTHVVAEDGDQPVAPGASEARVDVLPPFAGG